jgi:hypothetical protein
LHENNFMDKDAKADLTSNTEPHKLVPTKQFQAMGRFFIKETSISFIGFGHKNTDSVTRKTGIRHLT